MRGTFGWMFTTWLTLIALQALASPSAPSRVSQAFAGANGLLNRALDPTVPAIPDRAGTSTTTTTAQPAAATSSTTPTVRSATGTRYYA